MLEPEANPWHGQPQDLRLHHMSEHVRTAMREIDDILDGIEAWMKLSGMDPKLGRDLFPEDAELVWNRSRSFRLSKVLQALRDESDLADRAASYLGKELLARHRGQTPEATDA